jgi:competence protein ComQ
MSGESVCGVSDVALPGGIIMELAALAADIFDDIQDQDNDEQPWRKLSDAKAMNLAICLIGLSSAAVDSIENREHAWKVEKTFNNLWIQASSGQFQEVIFDSEEKITFNQYFELVKKKSGSFTAAACKIGAILGGAKDQLILELEEFGINFGIMNQIRNDLNDFCNFEKKKDFFNNRKTLPYVYLSSVLEGENAKIFKELTKVKDIDSHIFREEKCEKVKKMVIDEGVVQYCTIMYEIFRQKSMDIIKGIPTSNEWKGKMIKLVEESI